MWDMPNGAAVLQRFFWQCQGQMHSQRIKDALANNIVKRVAASYLQQSTQHRETKVTVGHPFAGWILLRQESTHMQQIGNAVITPAGINKGITFYAAGMAEQMTQGHRSAGKCVSDRKVFQIGLKRGIQIQRSLFNQLHNERRGEYLVDGTDLKHRIRGGFHLSVYVHNTGCGFSYPAFAVNGKCGTWYLVLSNAAFYLVIPG